MPKTKKTLEELSALQIRMPLAVQTAIRLDATKWHMTYAAFVTQCYSFAKEHGLDAWLAGRKHTLGDDERKAFQIHVPPAVAMAIKIDALKSGLKNGEFIQIVYAYAKKNGLYGFLKQ